MLLLWPTLWVDHIVAPSTVSLLLYLHLFLAPFSCSFSLSPVRYPSRCSYYLCVHSLSLSLSLSLSPVRHPSRCSYYLCVHCLSSLSLVFMISLLSLCLSCLYRLSAFVFLYRYIHSSHSFWLFLERRISDPHSFS
jgi:hypothetical protein